MSHLSIRHAKLTELPRIKYITKLAYKTPYKKNTFISKPCEPKNIEDGFLGKEFFIVVAVVDDKIVGAVRYKFVEKNSIYLHRLAVLKTYRNDNIGESLINKVEAVAKKKGVKKMLLNCIKEKKISQYYEKFGYKIDAVKKHQDHHDVYMSKKIK